MMTSFPWWIFFLSNQNMLKGEMGKDRFPSVAPAAKRKKDDHARDWWTPIGVHSLWLFFPSSAFLLSISLILLTLSLFFFAHLSLPSLWALWTHWRSVFCLTICLALSPVLRLGPVNKQGGVDVKKEGRKLGSIKWKKRERRAFWRDGGRGAGCDWRPGEKGTALKKFPYLFNPQSCLNI